jgi:aquaporin TIP
MNTKALVAEFIGTFALIFVGVSAIATNYIIGGGKAIDIVAIALAHGLVIAVMVSATAAISGGHLNPAVTFAAMLVGKIDPKNALGYVIFQCLGAIFAASLVKLVFPSTVLQAVKLGTPALGQGITPLMGLVMEFVLTFFLVFIVFGTAIDIHAPKLGGLFIGLTVTLDILAGGPISGGAMNPARYLGPALMAGEFQYLWLYWVGPVAGGAAAALVYRQLGSLDVLKEKIQESVARMS